MHAYLFCNTAVLDVTSLPVISYFFYIGFGLVEILLDPRLKLPSFKVEERLDYILLVPS